MLLAICTPAVASASCAITASCSSDLTISTKMLEVNLNTGVASATIDLPQQPADDQVIVSVRTTHGSNFVQLIDNGQSPYEGHPSTIYPVHGRKFNAFLCFSNYSGKSTTSQFNLEVEYKNSIGRTKKYSINDCLLRLDYNQPRNEELHIVNLNDFHGAGPGYGDEYFSTTSSKNPGFIRIAKEIDPIINKHPGSVFLTAGDNTNGESYSTAVHALSMFPVLKAMGARYCALGNHGFEWGIDPLVNKSFDEAGRTPDTLGNYLLTSNVISFDGTEKETWETDRSKDQYLKDFEYWNSTRVKWADPYKLLNMNGHLVCLIGLTTKLTATDGDKRSTEHLRFIDYLASANYADYLCQQTIGDSWYNSIEAFVLLTHVESSPVSSSDIAPDPTSAAAEIAANISIPKKVQAVISAHSHKIVCGALDNEAQGHKVWVGQAETAGRRYLDTKLNFDNTKPIGNRLSSVSMEVKQVPLKNESYFEARNELRDLRNNPPSEYVRQVIEEYDYQKAVVKNKLKSVVAHRQHGLQYPIVHSGEQIGHTYYCSDDIIDQMGAWETMAQMVGLASFYSQDIEEEVIEYPSLSFANIDSITVDLPEPTDPEKDPITHKAKVKLGDLYSIQQHENTMVYGYLSIWQIANIIDYLLSGATKFDYDKADDYFQTGTFDRNNLTVNMMGRDSNPIACSDTWKPVDFKGTKVNCRYLCGPLQFYGMKFIVEENKNPNYDRKFQLAYTELTPEEKQDLGVDRVPQLWIYDPTTTPKNPYESLYSPEKWVFSKDWLQQARLVPTVISSFLDTAGNAQNSMFHQYMDYNARLSGATYSQYSGVSLEMLQEFCRLTEDEQWKDILHFDLDIDIVKSLITGNKKSL